MSEQRKVSAAVVNTAWDIYWDSRGIADLVWEERRRQLAKWGLQTRDNGTHADWGLVRDQIRAETDRKQDDGTVTWFDILCEEVYEAFSETDEEPLERELVQSMAVIASWLQDIRLKREARLKAAA